MTGVFDSEHHSINDSETLLRRVIDGHEAVDDEAG